MAVEAKNKHVNALIANVNEVNRLKQIHGQITKKGPGRKHDVQVLHKSAIVLLTACWEAYVEDLVTAALEEMISAAKDHKVFPKYVLERVGSNHSGVNAWDLAGAGWKQALRGNLSGVLARTTGALNTPRTAQVDELFHKVLGLDNLSSSWFWAGRSVEQSTKELDELVTLRGSIAHRVSTSKAVTLKNVTDARSFIYRLAVKSHNRTCEHLKSHVTKSPWARVQFGKTS
jgi:hypothetical protein